MAESLDSRLDAIMNVLASLSQKTAEIERVIAGLHNDGVFVIAPSRVYHAQNSEETILSSIQQDPVVLQQNKPRVRFVDKFDGTHSKF